MNPNLAIQRETLRWKSSVDLVAIPGRIHRLVTCGMSVLCATVAE